MSNNNENREAVMAVIRERAVNGKLSCAVAREIAEELKAPYSLVGDICNEMKIKIAGCQLGCF